MAIVQSQHVKGLKQTIRPQTAGAVHVTHFTYDVGVEGALGTGDILELGIIPPYDRLDQVKIVTEGTFTGLTADVGVMSGEVGAALNPDNTARTSGSEFFAAADLTVRLAATTKPDALLLAPQEYGRSVGVKVSAAVPAAAGKRLHLFLYYHQ